MDIACVEGAMREVQYADEGIDVSPFADLVGQETIELIFKAAPKKVSTRIAKALYHYSKAPTLAGIDEEMAAIRLIAAEEELVVAIFEVLKLRDEHFPEHRDFVRKYKNHIVKQSFYPVLFQFRLILGEMMRGFGLVGLPVNLNWTAKPIVEGETVKLLISDADGKELIRHNPLAVGISRDDLEDDEIVNSLKEEMAKLTKDQHDCTIKDFLFIRADFRNKLLYATDAGSVVMGDTLDDLLKQFRQVYHDLIWVMAILLTCNPPVRHWGLVSQFISLYRGVLIDAGILRVDNTPIPAD
jgi:hypothetical protein